MKTEELIEYYLVYTDNGIERVHWCNVNGVKELVSPKSKVYGYVPDYFEFERLQEENEKLKKKLKIATKALKEYERCENGSYANKAFVLIKEVK